MSAMGTPPQQSTNRPVAELNEGPSCDQPGRFTDEKLPGEASPGRAQPGASRDDQRRQEEILHMQARKFQFFQCSHCCLAVLTATLAADI
ncbi:hypothetical protein KFL_000590310 [Klebsormidium nitens]|uniref:Uncharacterized protein n=1 Tax=Klebsormidium nitens TaxID=105231 RepID=A0A1Y1HXU2_KLENI|nr:hypothetical protein KFL_000590310 [Klebsormidium nitens]|eukprot:GAQ80678.1 hypothetical protein KFL_000590310 [Klebsormidium nitens]